jgi:hypothetical protein
VDARSNLQRCCVRSSVGQCSSCARPLLHSIVQFQQPHLRLPWHSRQIPLRVSLYSPGLTQLDVFHITTVSYPCITTDDYYTKRIRIHPRPNPPSVFARFSAPLRSLSNLSSTVPALCSLSALLFESLRQSTAIVKPNPPPNQQRDILATFYNALWHRRQQDRPAQARLAVSLPPHHNTPSARVNVQTPSCQP